MNAKIHMCMLLMMLLGYSRKTLEFFEGTKQDQKIHADPANGKEKIGELNVL